jgi:RNA polymerase sigma-70 factor (ECF subfamily)
MIDKPKSERFFGLFMVNQKRIYTFILMLVPHHADADEIMQETSATMWEKFEEFEPGSSFGAWGVSIARYTTLNFLRRRRNSHILFNQEMFDEFANQVESRLSNLDNRIEALRHCLSKLREKDRRLIKLHYEDGFTVKEMSKLVGRSADGLYKAMNRIHNGLVKCVHWTLAAEEM